jgi:TetR/AcrR family transcriptional regulator, regulator of autoinduction and epiphytic fitness
VPAPRFHRLPHERREKILRVARAHFARDGKDGASYNQIIADAQLSKTSAYQYFDGKDDLAATVLADVNARLLVALGPWKPAASAVGFWKAMKEGSQRLTQHLADHPDDLAILNGMSNAAPGDPSSSAWFNAVIENGLALGLIRGDVDRSLLLATTVAFFHAVDAWVLAAMGRGAEVSEEQIWRLLRGLWGSPKGKARKRRST